MKRVMWGLVVGALVAACGDDGGGATTYFRVDTGGALAPVLSSYDDGSGWTVAEPAEPGVLAVPVADTVSIAIVCVHSDRSVGVSMKRLAPLADETVRLRCAAPAMQQRETYPVTIIPATGFASVHDFGVGPGGGRELVTASPGRWDVVASTASRVLVRRGVEFPPVEPLVLDIERDGSDRVPLALTLPAPIGDEQVRAGYSLQTASGARGLLSSTQPQILTVPDELLVDGDRHEISLNASRRGDLRSVTTTARDVAAIVAELPPPLSATATRSDATTITWSDAPAGDHSALVYEAPLAWIVETTPEWLAANGQATDGSWSPPSLEAVPGWDPAWNLGAGPQVWALAIETRRDADGVTVATHTEIADELP